MSSHHLPIFPLVVGTNSREMGPDKKPRTYRASSMKNFVQFKERPEEFAKYLKEEKGVDIGGNVNWNNTVMWILIGLVLVAGGVGIWKLYQQYQKSKESSNDEIKDTRLNSTFS